MQCISGNSLLNDEVYLSISCVIIVRSASVLITWFQIFDHDPGALNQDTASDTHALPLAPVITVTSESGKCNGVTGQTRRLNHFLRRYTYLLAWKKHLNVKKAVS